MLLSLVVEKMPSEHFCYCSFANLSSRAPFFLTMPNFWFFSTQQFLFTPSFFSFALPIRMRFTVPLIYPSKQVQHRTGPEMYFFLFSKGFLIVQESIQRSKTQILLFLNESCRFQWNVRSEEFTMNVPRCLIQNLSIHVMINNAHFLTREKL